MLCKQQAVDVAYTRGTLHLHSASNAKGFPHIPASLLIFPHTRAGPVHLVPAAGMH